MPFNNEIIGFINDMLKNGSCKNEKLQPAFFWGLSSVELRKNTPGKAPEQFPAIITADGKAKAITPEDKIALQVYHKVKSNSYSYEKKSYGDDYLVRCNTEMEMIVITNSKFNRVTKDSIEPIILFGIPQRLSPALLAELKLKSCLILPGSSNMDHNQVFKQEFPMSNYFLNEVVSIFSIRYKIQSSFDQNCIDKCLCN